MVVDAWFGFQPLDVLHRIARRGAGAKARAADVDGVRPVVDGFDADVGIAGGGEQLELVEGKHGG